MPDSADPKASIHEPTSPLHIIAAWLVVLIPALWGVTQTARTSAKLFQSSPPAQGAPEVKSGAPAH